MGALCPQKGKTMNCDIHDHEIKEHFDRANAFFQLALQFAEENDRAGMERHFEWADQQVTCARLIIYEKRKRLYPE